MTRHLRWIDLGWGLAPSLASILINVFSNWLSSADVPVLWIVAMAVIIYVLVVGVLYLRKPPVYLPKIYAPLTLRHPDEYPTYARRGLVVFVSYFSQIKLPFEKRLSRAAFLEAARKKDWQALDLMNSNLETAIDAVLCHASKLEHCWLIASKAAQPEDGSLFFVPVLEAYLKSKGVKCTFHDDQEGDLGLTYHMDDDAGILTRVTNSLEGIILQAQQLGLPPEQVLVDFTSAPRITSLACFLTNLDKNRDLEFIGTHYERSLPVGPNYPMIFHFEIEKKSGSGG